MRLVHDGHTVSRTGRGLALLAKWPDYLATAMEAP
jgi:hypothetical protein